MNKYFDEVFGITAFPGATLLEVISGSAKPNKTLSTCRSTNTLREFGAQAVAALQNSATRVSFDLTVCTLIADFAEFFMYGDCTAIAEQTSYLHGWNTQGCPMW